MSDRSERADRARDRARALKGQRVEAIAAPYLFPTPPAIARRVVELAEIEPGMRVLEPSAGTGALLDALPFVVDVVAIEINLGLVQRLRNLHPGISVIQADFMDVGTGLGEFDRVIMNPPFDRGLDIKHILHAREFLAPGGRLVAVCADGPRQYEAFEPIAELYETLPVDAFVAQGTGVRTALVVLGSPS